MGSQQLDEQAIVEVAREIRNSEVRAKYLTQVCADRQLRTRLEHRLKTRGRWQFGLRNLFVATLMGATLSAGLAVSYRQAIRARQMEMQARVQAERALRMAEEARAVAEKAALEMAAKQHPTAEEENAP